MLTNQNYRQVLLSLTDWEPYLLAESHLPGPRGNLELAQVAADLATGEEIERLLAYTPERAPTNTPGEFVAVCGVIALGRLLAEGRADVLPRLQNLANDPRWRVREGVAMALQRWGDADMDEMVRSVLPWASGSLLEQRAAAAAFCEPRLLVKPDHARAALDLLDLITTNVLNEQDRKSEAFKALRKGLGYCWSVAVAALPAEGKLRFERWYNCADPDVAWIIKENRKKNRIKDICPPRLETPRLILRPFTEDDLAAAYTVFEGHPDVYQYDPGYQRSFEQRAELIRRYARENDEHGCGALAVVLKETNELIGYAGLQFYILPSEPFASPEVELFYKLGRAYWRQGFAAEACRELLNFAFETLRLEHTISCVDWRNSNSIRLLERLGGEIKPAPAVWVGYVIGIIKNPRKQA